METNQYPAKRWLYLTLGTIAMLCMGSIYGWSVLKAPLAETFGWSADQLSLAYSLCFCFFCIGNFLGSKLLERFRQRITLLVGGIFLSGGYFLLASLHTPNLMLLYLSFGVLVGIGFGTAYPVILAWVALWFPDRQGLCSGILMMGFGCSALVVGKPAALLFDVPGIGWRGAYVLLGAVALISLTVCAVVFVKDPDYTAHGKASRDFSSAFGMTPKEALKTPLFWRFYIYGLLISALGAPVIALAFDICIDLGATAAFAATLVGVLSAFNGISRVFIGFIYDRLGLKKTLIFGTLLFVVAPLTLVAAFLADSLVLGILGLCLSGLAYGYGPVISATGIRSFFGPKHFATIYSMNNSKVVLTSFYAPLVASLYLSTGSFVIPFVIIAAIGAAAFFLQFTIKQPSY